MAKNPAFAFYAQDYIVDTVQWDRGSKSLHVDLLAISWINGYIEANENGEPVGFSPDDMILWHTRVKYKWQLHDGKLTNAKQEIGREQRFKFIESQKEKGKKSAEARSKKTVKKAKKSTEKEPRFNHGSTAAQPVIPVQPYEEEIEIENELEIEFKEGGTGETKNSGKQKKPAHLVPIFDEVVEYPFGESFRKLWGQWKIYKHRELKFGYKTPQSEQAAINQLMQLSGGLESTAAEIVNQSMANGWKGLFEIKHEKNGSKSGKQPTGGEVTNFDLATTIAKHYSKPGG